MKTEIRAKGGISRISFLLSGVSYLFAVILFLLNKDELQFLGNYTQQFFITIVLSIFLTAGIFFSKNPLIIILYIGLKSLLFIVITYPIQNFIFINVFVGFSILLEIGYNAKYPRNIVLGIIFIVIANITFLFFSYHDPERTSVPFTPLLFLNGCYGIVIVTTSLFTQTYQHKIDLQRRIRQMSSTIQQLSETNVRFQQHTVDSTRESVINERKRISREIHDSTTYTLTNLKMMSEAAKFLLSSNNHGKLEETLENIYSETVDGLNNVRRTLRDFRSNERSHIFGLQVVERITRSFEAATGIKLETDYTNVPLSCGDTIDSFIFRFVQEGMTNALKHGRAGRIWIVMGLFNNTLTITVRDNGKGAPNIEDGIGFTGMKERITALEGLFESKNVSEGFEITAQIPYYQKTTQTSHSMGD